MPRSIEDPLRWFSFRTDEGPEWTVFFATVRGARVLRVDGDPSKHRLGITFRETRQIIVSAHQDRTEEELTTIHEIEHAKLSWKVGDIRIHAVHEERVVSKLERATHAVHKSLGFKLPRRPRGYGALKRKAQEIDGE